MRRELDAREREAAQNIKRLWNEKRIREDVTETEAAKALGWSQSMFAHYKNGRQPAGVHAIVKLAEYFGCKPTDIRPDYPSLVGLDGAAAMDERGLADVLADIERAESALGKELEAEFKARLAAKLYKQALSGERSDFNTVKSLVSILLL